MDPAQNKLHFDRSLSYLKAGNGKLAADECLLGLKSFPDDPNLLCLAVRAFISLRRLEEAGAHAEKALLVAPGFALAHETRGDVYLANGNPAKAEPCYVKALDLDPGRSDVHLKVERARNDIERTGKHVRQPRPFDAEIRKAADLQRAGEAGEAEQIYRDILREDPDHIEAIRLLGVVATAHKKFADAQVFLKRAVEIAPGYARAWADLSKVQCELELHAEAIDSGRKLVELASGSAESHIVLGNAYGRAGRNEEAIASHRSALVLRPGYAGAYSGLGQQLKVIGRHEEAIAAHRECIAANPLASEHYWALANMKTVRFEDSEVDAMESLIVGGELTGNSIVEIHNSLGFAYEDRKDFDAAFHHFAAGNELRRQAETYDPVQTEITTDRIIEFMDQEFLQKNMGAGLSDSSPIFIVGLPRSGSTLIDQILASHSAVEGTHELIELSAIVSDVPKRNPQGGRFPESILSFGANAWKNLGQQYIDRTDRYRSGCERFIDKNPNNFVYAGLMALILPNATIINARRHPIDSSFGTFKQLFATGQPFSYDLTEIGEYYLQYQRLMDHWQDVLPGKILDVHYEEVVADLDAQVERLLDHCGLPFEEACLSFHETERAIRTASSEQVRRPIYSSSVDLWKNYESHLGELLDVLKPLLPSH
jgi:tetratricopeptide (TPR) repeat protein